MSCACVAALHCCCPEESTSALVGQSLAGLSAQPAAELQPPEESASPAAGDSNATAPERKLPSIRASSRGLGAFLTQVKDATAKVRFLCHQHSVLTGRWCSGADCQRQVLPDLT